MAKQNEIEYAQRMNAAHAANKPFSDGDCGRNLSRMGAIFSLLPPPPARILDLGCGTGWTSLFYARAGYQVVGVDIAPDMIRIANELRAAAGLTNLTFTVSDYEGLAYRDEFDCAVFFDSLHHDDDEGLAVRKAFAALRPGGILLAEEPGVGHSESAASLAAVAKYGVTEKDMPPARVVALGRDAGFTGFRVFPHPDELGAAMYTQRAEPVADPFADLDSALEPGKNRSRWARLLWRARVAVSSTRAWRRDLDYVLGNSRWNGLVLMRKGGAAEEARAAA